MTQSPEPGTAIPIRCRQTARTWEQLRRRPSVEEDAYHRLADRFTRQKRLAEAVQVCQAWIAQHPITLERPIVIDTDSGKAVMGRPPENVQELLG